MSITPAHGVPDLPRVPLDVEPGPEVWLTALTRAMTRVTANADRQGVLHALAQTVVEEFGAALVRIWLYDPVEAALLHSAGAGLLGDDDSASHRVSLSETRAIVVRAFSGREVVTVNALSEGDWPEDIAGAAARGLQGYAGFPLLMGERTIGAMGVALRGPWPPLMVQALTALAQQAALALDYARVIEQTHALQAVAADLAQAVDLDALLDGIVRQTATALKADGCAVWLINPNTQNPLRRVTFGLSDTFTRAVQQPNQPGIRERGPWRQVRETGKALFTRDECGRALAEGDALAEAFAAEGIVSCGRLPLWEPGGRLIGMLVLYHRSERVYTESEARLAQAFTDQVAIAVHRVRIAAREQAARTALARQVERLTALTHITEQLLVANELDAVLRIVAESAGRLCDASSVGVRLLDRTGLRYGAVAAHGIMAELLAIPPVALTEAYRTSTPTGLAVSTGEPVVVDDYAAWPVGEGEDELALKRAMLDGGARAFIVAPLRVNGVVIGLLHVLDTRPRQFTPEDVAIVAALADQTALAIEHTRLKLRDQDAAVLEERTRLARELHDSVSQALFGITLGASSLKRALESHPEQAPKLVDYVLSLAHTGQTEMRSLIYELGPEAMGAEGLVAALNKQAAALGSRYELRVETAFCAEPALSLDAKHDLYRIAQESLHNTVKHARAQRVDLTLVQGEQSLTLTVRDDGVGFDPAASRDGHYGQQSLHERATRLGARLLLISAPGEGTTVSVTVPLPVPPGTERSRDPLGLQVS